MKNVLKTTYLGNTTKKFKIFNIKYIELDKTAQWMLSCPSFI